MAQLAIKGHTTRHKEVIEILEMLGGKNTYAISADTEDLPFTIRDYDNYIIACYPTDKFVYFTLEEFLEKFPYKVGDMVTHNKDIALKVVTMYWDDNFNIVRYDVQGVVDKILPLKGLMTCHLQPYKETMEDQYLNPKANRMDKEFEQEFQDVKVFFEKYTGITVQDIRDNNAEWLLNKLQEMSATCALQTISDLYDELHTPQYPKTYEECCKVLFQNSIALGKVLTSGYNCELLKKLGELLICRDAYWKIAGEQMGLGKPWEPDWNNLSVTSHEFIKINNGRFIYSSRVLAFPTSEICNTFYDNFKDLIEQCKELL